MTKNDEVLPPDGVPQLVRPAQVSAALDVPESTVQTWLNRATLPSVQPSAPRGKRYVRARDVANFANRHGLTVNWQATL